MKISVIGLGHVGCVAAAGLAAMGSDVIGIDVNPARVASLQQGILPIYEPDLSELVRSGLDQRNLRFLQTEEVSEPLGEAIIVTVGTPTTTTGGADLRQVRSALEWATSHQSFGTIIMKSTVPPGTGVRLRQSHLDGSSFQYLSNPEFLREGQAVYDWFHPDRVVVGTDDDEAVSTVHSIYPGVDAHYVITDITSAEMIKYASNAFLATKISFINEIANLCDKLGATIDDVSHGISLDPRIGGSFLKAGVGYGGSCFPKDVRALDYLALANDHTFELLRSVINVNNRQRLMPLYSMRQCFDQLSGVKVAVLGLSFKPDTDDIRESPSIDLIQSLVEEGARVRAYDPMAVPAAQQLLPDSVQLSDDLWECVQGAEAVVLMTEWPNIVRADWAKIARLSDHPRYLFDGRNALDAQNMLSLNFRYFGVGRGGRESRKALSQ